MTPGSTDVLSVCDGYFMKSPKCDKYFTRKEKVGHEKRQARLRNEKNSNFEMPLWFSRTKIIFT